LPYGILIKDPFGLEGYFLFELCKDGRLIWTPALNGLEET